MAKYPDNYKFTGVDLYASEGSMVSQRYAYDVFQWFGDIGGVFEFFRLFFYLITFKFAHVTHQANLTKGLYSQNPEKMSYNKNKKNYSESQ